MSQPTQNEKSSDFWVGWDSALTSVNVAVTILLAKKNQALYSKPIDALLDCQNAIAELRKIPEIDDLTTNHPWGTMDTDPIECRCNGWDLWRSKLPMDRDSVLPTKYDEDGYMLCPFCLKINNNGPTYILAQCDTCSQFFKGYKKYPRISYTCPECEN